MLCINFELIPIKFGFFTNFYKLRLKTMYYMYSSTVQGLSSKLAKIEILLFTIFSGAYTCSYVVHQL